MLSLAVSSISYDPFGKYLIILLRNNVLNVYNSTSFEKQKEIPLSPNINTASNMNTVK
jgi:hypothetical protein